MIWPRIYALNASHLTEGEVCVVFIWKYESICPSIYFRNSGSCNHFVSNRHLGGPLNVFVGIYSIFKGAWSEIKMLSYQHLLTFGTRLLEIKNRSIRE